MGWLAQRIGAVPPPHPWRVRALHWIFRRRPSKREMRKNTLATAETCWLHALVSASLPKKAAPIVMQKALVQALTGCKEYG